MKIKLFVKMHFLNFFFFSKCKFQGIKFRYRKNSKIRKVIYLTVLYITGKTVIKSEILKKAEGRMTAQGSWSRLLNCT